MDPRAITFFQQYIQISLDLEDTHPSRSTYTAVFKETGEIRLSPCVKHYFGYFDQYLNYEFECF